MRRSCLSGWVRSSSCPPCVRPRCCVGSHAGRCGVAPVCVRAAHAPKLACNAAARAHAVAVHIATAERLLLVVRAAGSAAAGAAGGGGGVRAALPWLWRHVVTERACCARARSKRVRVVCPWPRAGATRAHPRLRGHIIRLCTTASTLRCGHAPLRRAQISPCHAGAFLNSVPRIRRSLATARPDFTR